MARNVDDDAGESFESFDPVAYAKAVKKLKEETDTASTKAQAASSSTKAIEEKFGIPGKITKWGMQMLGKTLDQRKAEIEARQMVTEALGLLEDDQPDMIEESGAEEPSRATQKRRVRETVKKAARTPELVN